MQSNQTDSLSKVFQPIAAVMGLMIVVFGVLQAILPTGLTQPIGTAVAGFILTWALVLVHKWTWNTAGLTWLGTSFLLIIIHLVISQPATLVGNLVQDDGSPLSGLTLVITNSAGVDQKAVTDKDGQFEVRDVPDGKYTITSASNGKLIYRGEIPPGWQRIFPSVVNIGTYPIQVVGLSSAVPLSTISPSPTSIAFTLTPTASLTYTQTSAPTITNTPIITDASHPTFTPSATSILAASGIKVIDVEDYSAQSPDYLLIKGEGWKQIPISINPINHGMGVLVLFQVVTPGSGNFELASGTPGTDSYRTWDVLDTNNGGLWTMGKEEGQNDTFADLHSNFYLNATKGNWYYLLWHLDTGGKLDTLLWAKDNPSSYILADLQRVNGDQTDDWSNINGWRFQLDMNTASVSIARYEELEFPDNYVVPPKPPQITQ